MTHRDKNWTPGPWAVGFRNGSNANLVMARDGADRHSDSTIAQVYGIAMHQTVSEQRDAEGMPNAHLIAAAPRMVDEMERYLPLLERAEADPAIWEKLTEGTGIATANGYRYAISTAYGETEED